MRPRSRIMMCRGSWRVVLTSPATLMRKATRSTGSTDDDDPDPRNTLRLPVEPHLLPQRVPQSGMADEHHPTSPGPAPHRATVLDAGAAEHGEAVPVRDVAVVAVAVLRPGRETRRADRVRRARVVACDALIRGCAERRTC